MSGGLVKCDSTGCLCCVDDGLIFFFLISICAVVLLILHNICELYAVGDCRDMSVTNQMLFILPLLYV